MYISFVRKSSHFQYLISVFLFPVYVWLYQQTKDHCKCKFHKTLYKTLYPKMANSFIKQKTFRFKCLSLCCVQSDRTILHNILLQPSKLWPGILTPARSRPSKTIRKQPGLTGDWKNIKAIEGDRTSCDWLTNSTDMGNTRGLFNILNFYRTASHTIKLKVVKVLYH